MFELIIKVPARINILGNPSDANEGEHQTISCAINIWAEARIEQSEKFIFAQKEPGREEPRSQLELEVSELEQFNYGGDFDLLLAGFKTMLKYSPELKEKIKARAMKFSYTTEVPRQSGLGGSTLMVHLILLGLVNFYRLDKKKYNFYFLAELAQRAEEKELGITCGFSDRYVPLLGDIAYIDYRGKLFHLPIKQEPYCTYEKLGAYTEHPPLVVVFSGLEHSSADVHGRMRAKYLEEYKEFQGDYEKAPFMVRQMKLIGDTAWKGKIALLESDWERFGELMNENHKLVNEMMLYCGFEQGAGSVNNQLIELGRNLGALGAKLTGAGGGGSVFFLVEPGGEEEFAREMKKELEKLKLEKAQIWVPSIARQGAVVLSR